MTDDLMIRAAAKIGAYHADLGLEPSYRSIFPERTRAYFRAHRERKAELRAALAQPEAGGEHE